MPPKSARTNQGIRAITDESIFSLRGIVPVHSPISQARPPRRRQTNAEVQRDNAELRRKLEMAHGFVAKIAETQTLPAELLRQAHIVLRGDSEHG